MFSPSLIFVLFLANIVDGIENATPKNQVQSKARSVKSEKILEYFNPISYITEFII
jgi:hypothetical protein